MDHAESALTRFVQDLRRRKVFRAATAYAVSAWLVVAIADVVFPLAGFPDWVLGATVAVAIAGLPVAVLLSWLFDFTAEGITRTSPGDASRPTALDRRIDFIIIGVLALVIAILVLRPGAAPVRSIAVLPFEDFSDASQSSEYLADGLAEELLNALVTIEGLQVAARTSSFAFKGRNHDIRDIGAQLNVDTVLEGSVQRDGARVRVTAQLIDVRNGFHIWSQRFDRTVDDIFSIQDDIATAIVDALKMKLDPKAAARMTMAPAASFEAYDLYLLGRHYWHKRTPESLHRAVDLFRQATEADPEFARAYSGLADAYLLLRDYGDVPADVAHSRAEAAIARALQIDGNLAEAYASLGLLRLMRDDLVAAELAFRNAIELDPSYSMAHMWLGLVLQQLEGPAAAVEEFAVAHRTDVLHPVVNGNFAGALGRMGRYEEAVAHLERALAADPEATAIRLSLAWLASMYGRYDESIEWVLPSIENSPEAEAGKLRAVVSMSLLALGDSDHAAELLGPADLASEDEYTFTARALLLLVGEDYAALDSHVERRLGTEQGRQKRAWPLMWRALADVRQQDFAAAVESIEASLSDDHGSRALDAPNRLKLLGLLTHAHRRLGDEAAARAASERGARLAQQAVSQGWASPGFQAALAGHYAITGDRARAMAALDRAVALGWRDLWVLETDPRFVSLHEDADFVAAANRIRADIEVMLSRAAELVAPRFAAAIRCDKRLSPAAGCSGSLSDDS